MLDLKNWSFIRVIVASALWVVLFIGLVVLYIVIQFWRLRSQFNGAGSGGIGAVSISTAVVAPLAFAILFGPPIVLLLTWYFSRSR